MNTPNKFAGATSALRFLAVILFGSLLAISSCKDVVEPVPDKEIQDSTALQKDSVAHPHDSTGTLNANNPLNDLPKDTGGQHKAVVFGADNSPYGYYIYTPSGYKDGGPKFPLLIFLHGSGESGNSKLNAVALDKVLANGPPKLIKANQWSPKYPMIVASAQCHEGWWDYQKVRKFIEYVRTKYQVDTLRVYMTGLSMGGYGTYDQITTFGKNSHLAAAVPISGSGIVSTRVTNNAAQVPFWAFHGEIDGTVIVDFDKALHAAVNGLATHKEAKLTLYPGVGHDAWTRTYNATGMGKENPAFDPFNMDIYSWMLQYKKQ